MLKKLFHLLFDANVWRSRTGALALVTFATMLWFIVDWCTYTTFRAMSDWMLWTVNILAVCVLMLPWLLSRKAWLQLLLLLLLDGLFMANLMYCRTYFTAIPPESYGLASNLGDFTASVWDSLRWMDLGFAVILIAGAVFAYSRKASDTRRRSLGVFGAWALIMAVASGIGIAARGGFYKEYDRLVLSCYYSTCGVPTYTVAGHLLYCDIDRRMARSAEALAEVQPWLEEHERMMPYTALPDSVGRRRNLILITCESLESWVVGSKIGGKEITPYINSLIADSTTFYAPNVLTQVGAGRSSDARLIICTGLLPMTSSVYSMKFPNAAYPSLTKAMTEAYGSEGYMFTTDKPVTWNQEVVSRSFGYKRYIGRDAWKLDEMIGNPAKLSDGSFLRQSVAMLEADSTIWPAGESRMLHFITYSGHSPFVLPDEFKDPAFDISGEGFTQKLADYVTMAHYTDSQLHTIVDYLKSRPDYDETLVVITGDHEGLAAARREIRESSDKAAELVSAGQYTPLLILNSPVPVKYNEVMGQIDIYPTLLNLLGLDDYKWKGLGQSIFAPGKRSIGISTMTNEIVGDTTGLAPGMLDHLRTARRISDAIIRADMLK